MRCLTVFALFMWLLVVSRSSDYWLGLSPHVNLIALVDVEVCLGIPSCVTRWVPRGSRGLILGSTGRGRPLLYPASVFPTGRFTTVGIPVEEDLADIGMKTINVVINMECDGEAYWVKSLGELRTNQRVDQWVVWITNPSSVEEVPNTDCLI